MLHVTSTVIYGTHLFFLPINDIPYDAENVSNWTVKNIDCAWRGP